MNSSQDPPTVKIVFVGDNKVGKTSLLLSYTTNQFSDGYVPNILENYITQIIIDDKFVNLSLWDYNTLNNAKQIAYENADIFIIVFSVLDPTSFKNVIKNWYPELQTEELQNIPKLIIGNKIDARINQSDDHISLEQVFLKLKKAQKEFEKLNLIYRECSALTQEGLAETFLEIVKLGQQYKINLNEQHKTNLNQSQKQQNEPDRKDDGCFCKLF